MVVDFKLDRATALLTALVEGLQRDNTGTTVSVKARRPLDSIDGYVVGGHETKSLVVKANDNDPYQLLYSIGWGGLMEWLYNLPLGVQFVGAWLDNGHYHFDAVDLYSNKELALATARYRGEAAIFDGFHMKEMRV